MAKGKTKSGRLSVFKGREAKLKRAIFHILALKGPLTIYDIHKHVRTARGLRYTRYASVNKRVKALEESGYVNRTDSKITKAGFKAAMYELTARSYLAILLASTDLDGLIREIDEDAVTAILAAIANARSYL